MSQTETGKAVAAEERTEEAWGIASDGRLST